MWVIFMLFKIIFIDSFTFLIILILDASLFISIAHCLKQDKMAPEIRHKLLFENEHIRIKRQWVYPRLRDQKV